MERTNEPRSLVQLKTVDIPTSFIWLFILFDEALKYRDDGNCWGYIGTKVEPLTVEFCNFKQCHIFVNKVFNLLLPNLIQL
jgi:hypothetical protein